MAFVDPNLIKPAMDAISHGWSYGREARSIQFIKFEQRLDQPLEEVRREFRLGRDCRRVAATPVTPPELVAAASI
jgi:ubiquinone biosynthesis protein Coq4